MIDEKKITILENLLNERDMLISELQQENAQKEKELEDKILEMNNVMKEHENLVVALDELKETVSATKEKQAECNQLIRELKLMKKQYEKDMKNILTKIK